MSVVSQAGNYVSAASLLAQQYARGATKPRAFEDAALESIAQNDPARADALKKQLDDARQAGAQIGNAKQDVNESRKAAAAERVKQIKAQIQALKMMGGDPKSIARQVAQLARELSAAASEYASAGGGAQQASQPAVNGTTAIAGGNAAASEAADSGGASATADVPSATVREQQAAAEKKTDQPEDAAVSAAVSGTALAEGSRQYQENQKQQFKDAVQKNIAELRQKSSAAEADREFAQEVRALAAQLKALAKQQEQRLRQARDQSASGDLSQANQVLAEAESSASKISMSAIAVSPSVNIAV